MYEEVNERRGSADCVVRIHHSLCVDWDDMELLGSIVPTDVSNDVGCFVQGLQVGY